MAPASLPTKPSTALPPGNVPLDTPWPTGQSAKADDHQLSQPNSTNPLIRFPPPSSSQINLSWVQPSPFPFPHHHISSPLQYSTPSTSSSSTVWKTSKPIPVRPSNSLPIRPSTSSLPSLPAALHLSVPGLPPKLPTSNAGVDAITMEAGGLIRFGPGTNVSSAILVDDPSGDEAGVVDENAVDVEDLDDDDEDEDDIKLTTIKLVAKRKRVDTGSQHDTRRRKGEHKQGGLSQAGSAKGPADFKHKSTAQKQIKKGDAKMLAIPLPSRRFNKDSTRRATLFPVEQLPVFALPPLPEIKDEAALKQVFTHLSLFQKVKYKFEDPEDDLPKHYEKIEHVGDSLLGMIVTTWLHEIKPGLTPGTATRLKAHLVSNATLSHLSGLYNLPNRLIADPNITHVLRATTDVRAALMEAYIAGFYYSHSVSDRLTVALPALDAWLREMYEPLVDFFYTYMKNEHTQHLLAVGADTEGHVIVMDQDEWERVNGLATGMAQLVKAYAEGYERELKWEEDKYETSIGPLFKMTCVIDGMELGEGTRSDKRDARNVAAWEAAKKLGLTTDTRH